MAECPHMFMPDGRDSDLEAIPFGEEVVDGGSCGGDGNY